MDIQQVAQEAAKDDEVIDVVVKDRNGKPYETPTGQTVWQVVGKFASQYRQNERALNDKYAGVELQGHEARELYFAEKIACGVVGWKNVYAEGKPAPFSREAAARVMVQAEWVADQLAIPIAKHTVFFGAGSRSS